MKKPRSAFRPMSRAVALEPRLLFDGAGAVAAVDALHDDHAAPAPAAEPARAPAPTAEASAAKPAEDKGGTVALLDGKDNDNAAPVSLNQRQTDDRDRHEMITPAESNDGVLLVIDSRVDNYQELLADLPDNVQVRVIDGDESGLRAIGEVLAKGGSFDAIHIISHGTPGNLSLGSDQINSSTLDRQSATLRSWSASLSEDADILLYACDLAKGEQGQALIDGLAELTGADVAASIDPTGSAAKGGDWDLEARTGNIEANVLAAPGYGTLLADTAITDSATKVRVIVEDTPALIEGIEITDSDNPEEMSLHIVVGGGTATLTLNGAEISAGELGSADFTLTGTRDQLNAALKTLTYTPDENQNSLADAYTPNITLTATDVSNGGSVTYEIELQVSAVNDDPVLDPELTESTPLQVSEGGSANFSLDQLAGSANLLDPDIATGQQVIEQLVLTIDTLPAQGTLTFKGGVVTAGQVIAVTDLKDLVYTHNGTDLTETTQVSFKVTVQDGGGGSATGDILIDIAPANKAPTVSPGNTSLIEGQTKNVAPAIDLGDTADTQDDSSVTLSNIDNGGQGEFFYLKDGVETTIPTGTTSLTLTAAELATLSFRQDGTEPNAPGVTKPQYTVVVTDSGGGLGEDFAESSNPTTITLDIAPNNDDPDFSFNENGVGSTGNPLTVSERNGSGDNKASTIDLNGLLNLSDKDRDPSNTANTTPAEQLVYTIGTPPALGELQLKIGSSGGYDGNGWVTLGAGGRFTQADVDAGRVRYYQTKNVDVDTRDTFTFTMRDSAFGQVINPDGSAGDIREGAVRDNNGNILEQTFNILVQGTDEQHDAYEGDPRPATPGYGVDPDKNEELKYHFEPTVSDPGNATRADWDEQVKGAYPITKGMLEYQITREFIPDNGASTFIEVPASETVYTLTKQPSNGYLERQNSSGAWERIPTNGQFTQADINGDDNGSKIRFVSDGSEDHIADFEFKVSDGTDNAQEGSFAIDITPTNDRPTAAGGSAQVREGDGNAVRLGSSVLGMGDADLSQDASKRTGEGAQDPLWFRITDLPPANEGKLERWNGTAWVAVTTGEWLSQDILTAAADGGTSGLRYVHDGSEPLAYDGGPKVTFQYEVRDDLPAPAANAPFTVRTDAAPTNTDNESGNLSGKAEATINIEPVNDAPIVPKDPSFSPAPDKKEIDSTIDETGRLTSKNEAITVDEGGKETLQGHLIAVDKDNTTTQRQYQIRTAPEHGTLMLNGKALGVGGTFTQADIDAGRVTYEHNGDEVGTRTNANYDDHFTFVVSDGAKATAESEFWINVTPGNDKPTVETPAAVDVTGAGNTAVPVEDITVDDADLDDIIAGREEDFLRVEVDVLDGNTAVADAHLNYTGSDPTGARAHVSGKDSSHLVIQGTREQVNAALTALTVAFDSDKNSDSLKIRVTVDDRLYDASGNLDTSDGKANGGGELNDDGTSIDEANNRIFKDIALIASNSNDTPEIDNGTTGYTVNEGDSVTLGGFTLSDADSFDKRVTVVVELFTDAARTQKAGADIGQLVSGSNSGNTITLTGSLAEVEEQLNAIQFQGAEDYNGAGQGNSTLYLKTTFTDWGHADIRDGNEVSLDQTITIVPVNDAPTLAVPDDQEMSGGDYIDIPADFAVGDVKDTAQGATDYIEVTLEALDGDTPYGRLIIQTPGDATVDGNNTGTVVVKGTSEQVQAALNSLRYAPDQANVDKVVTIKVTADDKDNGQEGNGASNTTTATDSFEIIISGTNDAPVVTVPADPVSVAEDSTGTTIPGISFEDSDDFGKPERITVSVEHGNLDFATKTGLTLISGAYGSGTITIEGSKTALNTALKSLTYTPTGDYHGEDTLTVIADDRGNVGEGGVQTDSKTVTLEVTPVNDQPTADTDVTLAPIDEDMPNAGIPFSDLDFGYSDVTDNQTGNGGETTATDNKYFAVVGNAATDAQGKWQVSTDGGDNWIDIPVDGLNTSHALVFGSGALVRFNPAADYNGTPGELTVRLADGSQTLTTSTSAKDTQDLASNGNINDHTGAWNAEDRTIGIEAVKPVNDAPTVDSNVPQPSVTVNEDDNEPAGNTVEELFGDHFVDDKDRVPDGSEADELAGVAITGSSSDKGKWQYSTDDGETWTDVPDDVSPEQALLLKTSDKLRFVPTEPDFNGTPDDRLTVRLIDDSNGPVIAGDRPDLSGDNSGGTTPYSDANNEITLTANITPLNDAPTLSEGGATSDIVVDARESDDVSGTGKAIDVPLLSNVSVDDLDLGTTDGLDADTFGAGEITVTLGDARIDGDQLTIDDALDGIDAVTPYDPDTGKLVITLTEGATRDQVKAILEAVHYAHTSDDPTAIGNGGEPRDSLDFTVELSDGNNTQSSGDAGGPEPLSATLTGTLNIIPVNDPPVARDDTNEVTENTDSPTTGNLIKGTNRENPVKPDEADSDPDTPVDQLLIVDITPEGGEKTLVTDGEDGVTVQGKHGTLTIHPDGSYSYELDETDPEVNGLDDGSDPLTDVFDYTLGDGDGGTDNAKLTITIHGHTDKAPSITPTDGNGDVDGEATVEEHGLRDETGKETTIGKITVEADGGIDTVTIGSQNIPLETLKHLLDEGVLIGTPHGQIVITGFEADRTSGDEVYSGTIDYTYTLTKPQDTPNATEGTENINLSVTDKTGKDQTGTLTIRIIDDVPVASADTGELSKSAGPLEGKVYDNDAIGADGAASPGPVTGVQSGSDTSTPASGNVGVTVPGGYGSLILNADGSYTYTVDADNEDVQALAADGRLTDTFTYTITDADGDTSTTTLTITIKGNNPPVAVDDSRTTPEDTPVSGNVIGGGGDGDQPDSDPEGSPLEVIEFTIGDDPTAHDPSDGPVTIPDIGTITLNPDGSYDFVPAKDWNGTVPPITYTISDGEGGTDKGTLTIEVTPVNDPPVPVDDHTTTPEDTPVGGELIPNDSDPEGDPLTVVEIEIGGKTYTPGTPVNIPGVGIITVTPGGHYDFTPEPNWNGKVPPITYTVDDGHGGRGKGHLTIEVTPVNDPPVPVDDHTTTPQGKPVGGELIPNDSDPENDPLTVVEIEIGGKTYKPGTPVDIPGVGIIVITPDGHYDFTPERSWKGDVPPITYTVDDGHGGRGKGTLTIEVTPEDDYRPPVSPPPSAPLEPGVPSIGTPSQPESPAPWKREQAGMPSVYFHGDMRYPITNLPLPMHPALFVNSEVNAAQATRESADRHARGNPDLATPGQWRASSVAHGLGFVPDQFVLAEVRGTQDLSQRLSSVIESRYSRVSLGGDGLLGAPELNQPDPQMLVSPLAMSEAPSPQANADEQSASAEQVLPRGALSFTEQLRSGGSRLPQAVHENNNFGS